ncbi:MAG: DoxX family membrane protein, partial [Bacteroidaceae bacterium]|nr:DoxX family membrane protein [Bacteroidaceae bacterium]
EMNSKHINIIRISVGIVFLVSGMAKAYDTNYFGGIMASYGIEELYVLAPLVIFAELLLGLSLAFGIYTRYAAALTMAMVLILSTIYAYGDNIVGVKDCGCFGRMPFISEIPWLVYFRNTLLFGCAAYIFRKNPTNDIPLQAHVYFTNVIVVFTGAFLCGKTFKWRTNKMRQPERFEAVALSQHTLRNFVETSPDSTYMVTVFSYTCPHCLNSIGNIEQYEKNGIVDHVIGVAVENPTAEAEFNDVFHTSFPINTYPIEIVSKLSTEFPVSYFIKRDSIVGIMTGEVPSAYFLRHHKF